MTVNNQQAPQQTQQQQPNNGGGNVYNATTVGRASDVLGMSALPPAATQEQVQPPVVQQQQQPQQFNPNQLPVNFQQGYFGHYPQVPNNQQQQQQPQQAPPTNQQQQQAQQPDPFQQQQQHIQNVQNARAIVDSVDVDALRTQLQGVTNPQQQQQSQQQAPNQQTPPPGQQQQQQGGEADKNFEAFNNQFKQVMGVDLQTGIQNYQNLVKIAQDTTSAMKQQQQQIALREAKVELASTWMMDPDVQAEMRQGTPITQIVENRMQYLGRVYQTLPQQDQQQVNAAGTAGVIALWRSAKQQSQSQQVPIGSVGVQQQQQSFQSPTGKMLTREQIMALPDRDFESWGAALLDTGNYVQPQQQVTNNGSLQRTFR